MADYIYVRINGISDFEGYLINISLVDSFNFALGVDTVDLSIVQTTERNLLPISGLKKDFNFDFELHDDGTNKAFSVNNVGSQTALNKITTKDQLLFLMNNIISANANAYYEIYNEWLNTTFVGLITIDGNATGDSYFNTIKFRAVLKSGSNILSVI